MIPSRSWLDPGIFSSKLTCFGRGLLRADGDDLFIVFLPSNLAHEMATVELAGRWPSMHSPRRIVRLERSLMSSDADGSPSQLVVVADVSAISVGTSGGVEQL